MDVRDIALEIRDKDLVRRGQVTDRRLRLTATPVVNGVGEWRVLMAADDPLAAVIQTPGAGIIVSHVSEGVVFSGPMTTTALDVSHEFPNGQLEVKGVTDEVVLWNALAFPDPEEPDPSAQSAAYDVRSGPAESRLYEYVDANIGPSAPAARRIDALSLASDLARGTSGTTSNARFQVLGDLLRQVAAPSELVFRVIQDGDGLRFEVSEPVDRTDTVRLDVANGTIRAQKVQVARPDVTRAIVAGQGEGVARQFVQRTTTGSEDAETLWGVWARREEFIDRRDADEISVLEAAGDDALAVRGETQTVMVTVPASTQTMQYPKDWGLGDRIAVIAGDSERSEIVTSVRWSIGADGVRVSMGIGDTSSLEARTLIDTRLAKLDGRVSNVERNTTGVATVPIGGAIGWYGASDPPSPGGGIEFMIPDGRAISRTEYAELFELLGTAHGAGNGTTTFNIPDERGRVTVGRNSSDSDFDTMGEKGGAKIHTHAGPAHTHSIPAHDHTLSALGYAKLRLSPVSNFLHGHFIDTPDWTATRVMSATSSASTAAINQGVSLAGATDQSSAGTTGSAGTGNTGSASSLQPYIVRNSAIRVK